MNTTKKTKIKAEITNLKISQSLTCFGAAACTYRLAQIVAFKYMNLPINASPFVVNGIMIECCLLDGYFSYKFWKIEHHIEKLEKKLLKRTKKEK